MSSLKRKIRRNAQRLANERGQRIINATPLTPIERRVAGYHRPDGVTEDITQPVKPDKGLKGGSCNRTACQQPGAEWFNHSTRAYYCGHCAAMLNREANLFRGRDSFLDQLDHDLCTLDLPVGEVTDPDDLIGSHSHA